MKRSTAGVVVWFIWLAQVFLLGLKVTGTIKWSWWWVLSPAWGAWGVLIGGIILGCVISIVRREETR